MSLTSFLRRGEHASLAAAKKEKIRRLAEADLYYFCDAVLGVPLLSPVLHGDLCRFMQRPEKRKIVVMPREHMKSMIVSTAYPMWRALKNPNIRCSLSNAKLDNSRGFLGRMRNYFESNTTVKDVWDDVVWQDPRSVRPWNSDALVLKREQHHMEATFEASAVESSDTSKHFDVYIKDDWMNEINSVMLEQRQKIIERNRDSESLLSIFGGEEIHVGTRWGDGDLIGHLLREYPDLYIIFERGVYGPVGATAGDPIWPEAFTPEKLAIKKRILGKGKWSCQFLNDPRADGATPISRSMLRYWDKLPAPVTMVGAVDMSQGLRSGDFTVIMVGAFDVNNDLYIVEYRRGHFGPREAGDHVFDLQEKYGVFQWGMEPFTLERMFKDYLAEEQKRRKKYLGIVEVKRPASERSKEQHCMSVVPRYQRNTDVDGTAGGRVFHARGMGELDEEVTAFPFSAYDDLLDTEADLLLISVPVVQRPKPKEYTTRDGGYWRMHDDYMRRKEREAKCGRDQAELFR